MVEGAYLSVWRTPAGKLRLLPSLLERPITEGTATPDAAPTPVLLNHIEFHQGRLAFVDQSLGKRQVALTLDQLVITLDDLRLPALTDETHLHLSARIQGRREPGQLTLDGSAVLASQDSDAHLSLRAVDLLPLAPYLLKGTDTQLGNGTVDLELHSQVRGKHLHAPGQITLRNLTLNGQWLYGPFATRCGGATEEPVRSHFRPFRP